MSNQTKRPRLEFLDGMRGLCAVYIALFHAELFNGYREHSEQYSLALKPLEFLLSLGHYCVAVFIVLSGFCLAIPAALSPDNPLRGGLRRTSSGAYTESCRRITQRWLCR
jgi:peptidoglycan/LPS O-acetylase OafA/YrhL